MMRALMVIRSEVSQTFEVTENELVSGRRAEAVTHPRMAGMWLSRELTPASFPEIGRVYRRDHSTVMKACQRIPEMRAANDEFDRSVGRLHGELDAMIARYDELEMFKSSVLGLLDRELSAAIRRDPVGMLEKLRRLAREG